VSFFLLRVPLRPTDFAQLSWCSFIPEAFFGFFEGLLLFLVALKNSCVSCNSDILLRFFVSSLFPRGGCLFYLCLDSPLDFFSPFVRLRAHFLGTSFGIFFDSFRYCARLERVVVAGLLA